MKNGQKASTHTVKFFPVFLGATLAVMVDNARLLIDETIRFRKDVTL